MRIACARYHSIPALIGVAVLLVSATDTAAQSIAKFEPADGLVYHGAFPISQDSTAPGDYWLDISSFESLSNKNLALVLWYADWSSNFQNAVGNVINQHLKPKGKVIEVGWIPNVSLDEINSGAWDSYLAQWFTDARINGEPIFLRFANEMNGTWLAYDGWNNGGSISTELGWLATEKYKTAWRRVYSISRQMHACNIAFVWAPNYQSWPDPSKRRYAWNHWRNYYPGDEYVDWVGVDVYDFDGSDPRNMIQPFYDEYAARKPIILAETAGHTDSSVGADKVRYIQQLFDSMETSFPRLKACIWFNCHQPSFNWRIEETSASLTTYRGEIANSRYITTVIRNEADAIRHPTPLSICTGGTGSLSVGVVDDGTLTYSWQRNGLTILDGGHYSGAKTATLTVSNAAEQDTGNYRCIITGGCVGSTTSNLAAVTLKTATTIIQQPLSQTAIRGSVAMLSVKAIGEGSLNYQWQKNDLHLSNSEHHSGTTTPTLTISACHVNDIGAYRCMVTGGCGAVMSEPAILSLWQLGDFDLDEDVDQEDFGHLQACLTSSTTTQVDPACQDAKLDDDDFVDHNDLDLFLRCMSGPNVTADPNCAT